MNAKNNGKNALLLFSCLACLSLPMAGFSAPVVEPVTSPKTGAWSQTVDGVQGRLLVTPGGKVNGTQLPSVYLELRNVADLMNPVSVYYGGGEGLRLEVVDGRSKKVAPDVGDDFDAVMPLPYGVVLPHNSSLRFLVSVSGWGIPKNAGTLLAIGPVSEGPIVLPSDGRRVYFLQGTFSARAVKKAASQGEWQGTLTLPGVCLTPLSPKP